MAVTFILVILALVVWLVASALGGDDEEPGTAQESVSPQETEDPTEHPDRCGSDDLDVTLEMSARQVTAGEQVTFTVSLANGGERPCLVDGGTAGVQLEVWSGEDLVWSSAHCLAANERELLLDVGMSRELQLSWSGSRSAEGCPGGQQTAAAGTYRVELAVEGRAVELDGSTRFELV